MFIDLNVKLGCNIINVHLNCSSIYFPILKDTAAATFTSWDRDHWPQVNVSLFCVEQFVPYSCLISLDGLRVVKFVIYAIRPNKLKKSNHENGHRYNCERWGREGWEPFQEGIPSSYMDSDGPRLFWCVSASNMPPLYPLPEYPGGNDRFRGQCHPHPRRFRSFHRGAIALVRQIGAFTQGTLSSGWWSHHPFGRLWRSSRRQL